MITVVMVMTCAAADEESLTLEADMTVGAREVEDKASLPCWLNFEIDGMGAGASVISGIRLADPVEKVELVTWGRNSLEVVSMFCMSSGPNCGKFLIQFSSLDLMLAQYES